MLVEKSLEEFYEVADGYYPAHLPKYPSFRLKSASTERADTAPSKPSGHQGVLASPKSNEKKAVKSVSLSTEVTATSTADAESKSPTHG